MANNVLVYTRPAAHLACGRRAAVASIEVAPASRLRFAVGRFGERVALVSVRLLDANGPRGGTDKVCRVLARVRPIGAVTVEERDSEIHAAVDRVMDRLGRTVARGLERVGRGRDELPRPLLQG